MVERLHGNRHMTCDRCWHHFCFDCGNQWENRHVCPPSAPSASVLTVVEKKPP
jgi:hypothetical protein